MVEINNKTDVQYVYYPKTQNSTGPYTLHIHSELSQKDWHFENVEDKASLHDYYKFLVDYSSVDDGEFNYQIISNEEVMDTGLLRIGIGQANVVSYDTPNEVIQYDMYGEPTERYQHKSISATSNGTYNVLPDEGYVALSEVDVYVNVPSDSGASYESGYTQGYDDGFGSGYTSGKTDGIAEQKAKLVATAVTSNGTYSRPDGYSSINVSVPQTGHTDQELQEAYSSGKTEGAAEQKAKLVATSFTENRTYTRADGWNSVSVNVPQTGHTDEEMQQAYVSGQTYQKSLLVSTAVTQNGTYSRPDGYSSFVVNVPSDSGTGYNSGYTDGYNSGYTKGTEDGFGSGYTSGKTDGAAEQKAKLVSTAFTQNGTYTRTDGWNSVFIDVSGYTEQDLLNAFNSGYTNGKVEGYNSGWTNGYNSGWSAGYISGYTDGSGQTPSTAATAITVNAPSAITGTGKVTVTVEPSTAIVDLVYASSDTSIATVDSNGNITVLSAGTISITVSDRNTGIYGYAIINVEPASGLDVPLTVEVISGGTILWKANESATPLTIQFSLNEGPWTNITSTTGGTAIAVVAGDVVQFRGDNATYCTGDIENGSNQFLMQTGRYVVRGNIMSMIDSVNFPSMTTFGTGHTGAFASLFKLCTAVLSLGGLILPAADVPDYAYYRMFYGCVSASTVPALPATTLGTSSYEFMFGACRGLTNAPVLPATVLGDYCYKHLFSNTSITAPPSLPATTLARGCYYAMFDNCKFTTPPSLPATTLEPECYESMFTACLNLTTAPTLPATVMQDSCYQGMFSSCISLQTPPVLSSTTLAPSCYADMFSYCTSLTTAPELPATTLANNCYQGMFSNCTNLTTAQTVLPATSLTSYCYQGMYTYCGRMTVVPELPATILADYCYEKMFQYCSGLTRGPEILAQVLPKISCRRMFEGCKNLSYIKCLATDISASNCTYNWVSNVFSTGTFVKDASMTGWPTGINGIPTGWTIVDAQ